jgi:integrase
VEFRDPISGREVRRSLHLTHRRAAERLARDLAEEIARGRFHLGERKPWAEAVAAYLAHGAVHKEPATVDEDRRTLTRRFQPPAAVRYVDDLRAEHVESYVAARKALGRSPFRINRELRTIRAFCNWCLAPSRRWLEENPAKEVPQLPEPQGIAARALDAATVARLLQAVEGTRLEGPVLLALNHGLREGELVHLRREAVELSRGVVWVRHDPLTGWMVKERRERLVYLNEVTLRWLGGHLAWQPADLCPYVFIREAGQPWTREALVVAMGRVMRRIGVPRGGFHMLRHTWATRQVEAGTSVATLKLMGGWRDWRSMDVYMHLADEEQRQAAERVSFGPRHGKVIPLRLG